MDFTYTHEFDASAEDVAAMLANPDFARERAGASGSTTADALVDADDDGGFSVALRRTVPAASIPQEMRSFVGSELTVTYTEVWEPADGHSRTGTFAVDIAGTPGRAAGSLDLVDRAVDEAPDEASEVSTLSDLTVHGQVTVRVPLVGTLIERAVATAVERGLDAELAAADAWLARRT